MWKENFPSRTSRKYRLRVISTTGNASLSHGISSSANRRPAAQEQSVAPPRNAADHDSRVLVMDHPAGGADEALTIVAGR
jgi:hypothetical protein